MLFGNRVYVGLTWSTVNRIPLLDSQLWEQVNNVGMVVSPLWLGPGNSHVFILESNQVIFIDLRSSKDHYKQPGGGVNMWEGSFGCEFLRGLREWFVGGGGLNGYFGEQGLPVDIFWKENPTNTDRLLPKPQLCPLPRFRGDNVNLIYVQPHYYACGRRSLVTK